MGVALLVGYHAGPQESTGVLAHCYSGLAFADLRLNDQPLTELWLNALLAGARGVPVGLVTGDDAICRVATELLPDVVAVSVKTALGQTAARSLHPRTAREAVRDGARRAVEAATAGRLQPLQVPADLVLDAEFRPNGAAELAAKVPGSSRMSARVVRRRMRDPDEMLDVIAVWADLTAAYVAR